MLEPLPEFLKNLAITATERNNIDFKRVMHLDKDSDKAELAKDVCAISNCGDRRGYLVIGVSDKKARKRGHPAVPGLDISNEIDYDHQIVSAINNYCENPPDVSIDYYQYEDKKLCVVTIMPKIRPHLLSHATTVLTRRLSYTKELMINEVLGMVADRLKAEAVLNICQELIQDAELLPQDSDQRLSLGRIIIDRIRNALRYSPLSNEHKFYYVLAQAYFMQGRYQHRNQADYAGGEYHKCIASVERSITQSEDPTYILLEVEASRALLSLFFTEVEKESDRLDGYRNDSKESALFKLDKDLNMHLQKLQILESFEVDIIEYRRVKSICLELNNNIRTSITLIQGVPKEGDEG
ncbi:MAG: ATP-binding protein [Herpetosiphonaceae bacterium]|nr:ATP-binding protein [Herpetosiphonaceae bacterium]